MDDYILSVDQSTAATKIYLFDREGRIVRRVAHEHRQYYPRPGWAEHDAREIWNNARRGIDEITEGLAISQVLAISIANQRETTVLWSRKSGEPLCPAIVWQDVRAEGLTRELAGYAEQVRDTTGLPLSAYYSAAKAAFALQNLGAKDDVHRHHRQLADVEDVRRHRLCHRLQQRCPHAAL